MSERVVGVIGGGRWGRALARAVTTAGNHALLCTRRSGDLAADGIEMTESLGDVGKRCTVVLVAVPSLVARAVARTLGDHIDGRHLLVHAVRGLSHEALQPLSDVLREETPTRRVGALGGPVLADDLLEARPAAIASGSRYVEVLRAIRGALESPSLRVYETSDIVGLEWASAMVGAIAVALGFARSWGISPGLLAALMTRAMHEAARIGVAAGAEEKTFFGLAGFGDLMAAMGQDDRPEVRLGRAIAEGVPPHQARAASPVRIEAFELVPRVVEFAKSQGVRAPIFEALQALMTGEVARDDVLQGLMTTAHVR